MIKRILVILPLFILNLVIAQDTLLVGYSKTIYYEIPLNKEQTEIDYNYLGGLSQELEVIDSYASSSDSLNTLNFEVIIWSPGTYYFPKIEIYQETDTIRFAARTFVAQVDTMALEIMPSKNIDANLNYFDYRTLFLNWVKRNALWLVPLILLLPLGSFFGWKYYKKLKAEQERITIKDQININVEHLIDPAFTDRDKLELAQETLSLLVLLRYKKNAFKWSSREFINVFRDEMTAAELSHLEEVLAKSDRYKYQNIDINDKTIDDLMRSYYEILTRYGQEKEK